MQRVSFWCEKCKEDFIAPAREGRAFSNVKWYAEHGGWSERGTLQGNKKNCREMCFRYVDPKKDPYYWRSTKIQRELAQYARDLIQPGHPDFDRLYPQHKKKREEDLMKKEKEEWERNNLLSSRDKKKLVL